MSEKNDFSKLVLSILDKKLTRKELLKKAEQDFNLIPLLLEGVSHPRPSVKYSCSRVLIHLSKEHPDQLYSHFDFFIGLLDSKYRILTWTALAILANLTRVDVDNRFDTIFDKYYSFLEDEYMVTVANVVVNSSTIALAKPYLIPEITNQLLKVDNLSISPHLTEECKRVIAQYTIKTLSLFFDSVDQKERVLSFVGMHRNSPRKKLKTAAEKFLEKWG